jgi:ribonuclease HII
MNMLVVGIDEVGRGAWAGPLLAGAVILDPTNPVTGLTDSKLLSPKKRNILNSEIILNAMAYGIGWVSSNEVDSMGLTVAVSTAMQRALDEIKIAYDEIIIDGDYNYLGINPKVKTLIKADLTQPNVSAASIIAKVARDNFMVEQAKIYPGYGFERNVGYGTKDHSEGLIVNGVCSLHRLSFKPIKKFI